MTIFEIFANIALSITATSIWGVVGFIIYRKEKLMRRRLAFYMLHSDLDRLKDHLVWIYEFLSSNDFSQYNVSILEEQETKLIRYAEVFNYEWLISHLPYETKKVVWMLDLDYILSNCREMANEMYSLRSEFLTQGEDVERIRNSLIEISGEVKEAVEGELNLIPEKYRKSIG